MISWQESGLWYVDRTYRLAYFGGWDIPGSCHREFPTQLPHCPAILSVHQTDSGSLHALKNVTPPLSLKIIIFVIATNRGCRPFHVKFSSRLNLFQQEFTQNLRVWSFQTYNIRNEKATTLKFAASKRYLLLKFCWSREMYRSKRLVNDSEICSKVIRKWKHDIFCRSFFTLWSLLRIETMVCASYRCSTANNQHFSLLFLWTTFPSARVKYKKRLTQRIKVLW